MNLSLLTTFVDRLSFEPLDEPEEYSEEFTMDYGNAFASEEDVDTFQVFFQMNIGVQKENYRYDSDEEPPMTHTLKIRYVALFKADEVISTEFKESGFPRINAPAIAYPFLRSFLGTFLLNAGYKPILLPSFNFVKASRV
ncbi:protein-export chaperone SecB [Vibrio fluvialis]|nr:protein-export chaperone SecB [Vibrio fluvialis]